MKLSDLRTRLRATISNCPQDIEQIRGLAEELFCLVDEPASYIRSAVLILFYNRGEKVHLCVSRRPQRAPKPGPAGAPAESIAPGAIVLPGGKVKEGESEIEAALREASEEVSARITREDVVGTLPTYWRVLGTKTFRMTPVVAVSDTPQTFSPSEEVEEIIEVPLINWLKTPNPLFPVNQTGENLGFCNAFAMAMLRRMLDL